MEIQLIGTATALKWLMTTLSFFLYFSSQKCDSSTLLPKIRWVPLKDEAGLAAENTIPPSPAMSAPLSQHFLVMWPPPRAVVWATRKSTHIISMRKSIIWGCFPFPVVTKSSFSLDMNIILLDEEMLLYFPKTTGVKSFFLNLKSSEIAGLDLEVGPCPADATYVSIYTSLSALTDNLFYQVH